MVFDFSGSMDDFTYVTLVYRYWDNRFGWDPSSATYQPPTNFPTPPAGSGRMVYWVTPKALGANGSNTLEQYVSWNWASAGGLNGMATNCLPPQRLNFLGNPSGSQPNAAVGYAYDAGMRCHIRILTSQSFAIGADSGNDYGSPPSNCYRAWGTASVAPYGHPYYCNAGNPTFIAKTVAPTGTPGSNSNAYANRWDDVDYHPYSPYQPSGLTFGGCNPGAPASVNVIAGPPAYGNPNGVAPFTDLVVNIGSTGGLTWPLQQPLVPTDTNTPFGYAGTWASHNNTGCTITFPGTGSTYKIDGVTPDLQYETSELAGQSFDFRNLPTLVEAARGNMEDEARLTAAYDGINTRPNLVWGPQLTTNSAYIAGNDPTPNSFPACKVGFQKAYYRLAMHYLQPFATAVDGAYTGFYQKINNLADCKYGFVGFSPTSTDLGGGSGPQNQYYLNHASGRAAFVSWPEPEKAAGYGHRSPYGANFTNDFYWRGQVRDFGEPQNGQGFLLPRYPLNATDPQVTAFRGATGVGTNGSGLGWDLDTSSVTTAGLFNAAPLNATELLEGLDTAADMFKSGPYDYQSTGHNRTAARRAVVLFTDGIPTNGGTIDLNPGTYGGPCTQLRNQGCALFVIALAWPGVNNLVLTGQATVMTDDPSGNGLCKQVGGGSKFIQVSTGTDVKNAFASVVRRLTQGKR